MHPRRVDNTTIAALLAELRALYAEVDALYAGASCESSTECCRFGVTGRQPYVTSIELVAIERAVAARGGSARVLKRRALPLAKGRAEEERACPMLDARGRCTIYADRPFGCRTFFCSRAIGELPAREDVRDLLNRLRSLAARHALGGEDARPLERALHFG